MEMSLTTAIALTIILILLSLIIYVVYDLRRSRDNPYELKEYLSEYEKAFISNFNNFYPTYRIYPKVCLKDFLKTKDKGEQSWLDKIYSKNHLMRLNTKRIDFIVLDENLSPLFLINVNSSDKDLEGDSYIRKLGLSILKIKRGSFPEKKVFEQHLFKFSNKNKNLEKP